MYAIRSYYGQTCGLPAEWHFARVLSYAQMYLLTGYSDFWGIVAYLAQWQQNSITSEALANTKVIAFGPYDNPRFNYASKYGALLAAMMIDATIPVNGQWFAGRAYTWTDQLEWTIAAIENNVWDFKWIPFQSGSGTMPAIGTTISQSGATASLLAVSENMNHPHLAVGQSMPESRNNFV